MMNDAPASSVKTPAEELDLREIFRALWNTRRWVLIAIGLVTVAFIVGMGLARMGLPVHTSYRAAVQFTFPQLEKEQYPSGEDFAITDLTAPAVLQKVYDDNKLQTFNIAPEAFEQSISIRPYAPTYDNVARRYRQRLSAPDLTFADRQSIEAAMQSELTELGQNSALIEVQIIDRMGIPDNLGYKIAADIAASWSDFHIRIKNVLSLPMAATDSDLIDLGLIEQLDYPLTADLLLSAAETLKTRADELMRIGGALPVMDEVSGKNLLDLRRDIDRLNTYTLRTQIAPVFTLGISRNQALAAQYFEQQFEQTIFERDELAMQAQAVLDSLALIGFQEGNTAQADDLAGQQVQIGSDVVNQVVRLANRELELATRLKLTEDLRDLRKRQASAEKRGKSLSSFLEALRDADQAKGRTAGQRAQMQSDIDAALPVLVSELNTQWRTLNRLTRAIGTEMTNHADALYRPLALEEPMVRSHPVYSGAVLTFYIISVLTAAITAMFANLVRQILAGR